MPSESTESIVLAGGCFWCVEAALRILPGVVDATCGYAQGHVQQPSYEAVCAGHSGHAEVVRVRFDPARLDLRRLLDAFFAIHDPRSRDRQGADVGHQYRSGVYFEQAAQEAVVREAIATLPGGGAGVTTEVEALRTFWPAEAGHQRYFERHPEGGYCRLVIAPKVEHLTALLLRDGEARP